MNQNLDLFPDFVGQSETKRRLSFYLNAYHNSKEKVFPNTIFASARGCGKSSLARSLAKNLYEYNDEGKIVYKEDGVTPKKKTFIEINASTIKNARSFVNDILIRHCCNGKKTTLFCDEIHALKPDVTQILLSTLAPSQSNRNEFSFDDYLVEIDFKNFTFLCATTETDKLFPPLLERMVRCQLEEYTPNDLAQIVQKSCPDVKFTDDILEKEISFVLRGSPRMSVRLAADIKTYLCDKKVFGMKEWNDLKRILSIKRYGLTNAEISLLRYMASNPNGLSLTNLSSKTNLSRTVIQADYEMYLQRLNLMTIEAGRGRVISSRGLQVLKELDLEAAG